MENETIPYDENFQIIYVDILPSRRWSITPNSLRLGCAEELSSRECPLERKKHRLSLSHQYYLRQMIKVNINSDATLLACTVPLTWHNDIVTLPLSFSSLEAYHSSAIIGKMKQKSSGRGTSYSRPDQYSSKPARPSIAEKAWEIVTAQRNLRRHDNYM